MNFLKVKLNAYRTRNSPEKVSIEHPRKIIIHFFKTFYPKPHGKFTISKETKSISQSKSEKKLKLIFLLLSFTNKYFGKYCRL